MARDKLDSVLRRVIKQVTPSNEEKEKVRAMTELVMKTARVVCQEYSTGTVPMKLDVVLAGSFVRDTWMPHKKEFDVFIRFPEKTTRQDLEVYGLEIGKKVVKKLRGSFIIAYAEHPYVRAKIKGYAVDIVPSYRVSSAARIKSAVDRTPFHNKWLEKHMAPSKAPQVRIMKQFIRAQGLYGSDTRVQGFSGYLCELLITKFKTFRALVKAAKKWQAGKTFIDINGQHRPSERSKTRFKGQPLIVIDPVDPERNVAAALSKENFGKFVAACDRLLKKPSLSLFNPETVINMKRLESLLRKRNIIGILFSQPQVIQDVLWPQMRKTAKRLAAMLEDCDFRVSGWVVWSDEEFTKGSCIIMLELVTDKLPAKKTLKGPPTKEKAHSKNFLKKYKPLGRTFTKNGYWFAEFSRQFRQADAKLNDALSGGKKELRAKGIPSHIAKAVPKGFRLLKGKQIIAMAKKKRELAVTLLEWLGA